jgi:6-phosphogluconolactonase (cycloisomerase 2 family)
MPDGMFAAEILLPEPNESFPGTFIYTSNRNDPDPGGDTIAIFSLAAGEDQPKLVNEVRTGLNHVRGMVFGGDDDKYLVVGGVEGGGVKVFERIDGGKGLEEVAKLAADVVARPTGFLWYY